MAQENQNSIRLINTAIIKSKEKRLNLSYQSKLSEVCKSPAINALFVAISDLAKKENISKDQAAIQIVDTIRKLDTIWSDYVMMEGMDKLKDILKNQTTH